MDNISIIKKFMSYANYDPNQSSYNLLSVSYEYKRAIDKIRKLTEYDPTGAFSVLYAKQVFMEVMTASKTSIFNLLSDPHYLDEEMDMWKTFCEPNVLSLEEEILTRFNEIFSIVDHTKQLGKRDVDAERKTLCKSIESVVEELPKCNEDLFLRGGPISPLSYISTQIHVFNWLADCLLTLENSPDGVYLCFIRNMDENPYNDKGIIATADGYFGFYIKSNGTLLSINEKVNEKYPGEHKHHRNARYSDDKLYNLFPYAHIFSFEDHDYKGVATTHIIDDKHLDFLALPPAAYQPLILSMMMLNAKYANVSLDNIPIKYVDSLLPVNIALQTPGQSIMIPDGSSIIAVNKTLSIKMTTEGVINGIYAKKFAYSEENREKSWREKAQFSTNKNLFVELYGDGFQLNESELIESNRHLKYLSSSEVQHKDITPNNEFVGTTNQFEIVAYKQAREQLAEYIRDQMYKEYVSCGGKEAIVRWFTEHLIANKSQIFDFCIKRYEIEQQSRTPTTEDALPCSIFYCVTKTGEPSYDDYYGNLALRIPFNKYRQYDRYDQPNYSKGLNCCINTDTKASLFFTFRVRKWEEIQALVGTDVTLPKILLGYDEDGHYIEGNSILDATDECTGIGTPFENVEIKKNKRYWQRSQWSTYLMQSNIPFETMDNFIPENVMNKSPETHFSFTIGFSKRGFAKVLNHKI